jgi:hypothetical protein
MTTGHEPTEYVVARIQEALILDDRLAEQGLDVVAVNERIVVRGKIATDERRAAALELVRRLAGGREIVDDVDVLPVATRTEPEVL